ncbi:MAG: NusA-like transcription termination signal-binding factor [Candidatus Nanoarchaeia archaeon]|jgi:N utilization substance protein A|nr:NusA-like transcription termination signal-binding factor [Candidatus Nanoarchaeia archaeon]|tara:strand:+ start:61613 stop:62014 length:402 start_codon:yes stop_codon:yes gene_type:complete
MRQFTKQTIDYINLFETLTKARVKDCFVNPNMLFIVEEGDIGKAVGKKGKNVFMVSKLIKKKIRIIEFNNNVEIFIKNLIYPIEGKIYKENNLISIELSKSSDKGIILGRERKKLQELQEIVNKYFNFEIKVK